VTRPRSGHPFLDAGLEQPGSVLAFAHRGGAFHPDLEGLENTLAAFQHAVDLGYRHLETDVHATRDGVLLAFHDTALDRVTSRTGRIEDLRYVDVAAAMIGDREEIPTLQTLLMGGEVVTAADIDAWNNRVRVIHCKSPLRGFYFLSCDMFPSRAM